MSFFGSNQPKQSLADVVKAARPDANLLKDLESRAAVRVDPALASAGTGWSEQYGRIGEHHEKVLNRIGPGIHRIAFAEEQKHPGSYQKVYADNINKVRARMLHQVRNARQSLDPTVVTKSFEDKRSLLGSAAEAFKKSPKAKALVGGAVAAGVTGLGIHLYNKLTKPKPKDDDESKTAAARSILNQIKVASLAHKSELPTE